MNALQNPYATRAGRILFALFGGYFLTAGYISAVAVALSALGLARSEAASLGLMTGMIVYVTIVLWVAATPRPLRLAAGIAVAAIGLHLGATLLTAGGS
ncbi:MAG: iron transporter [Pseudomonadota bacterium]